MGVLRVVGSGEQGVEDWEGVGRRPPLTARRELAADKRVGVGLGQVEQARGEAGGHPVVVAQQADRPAPDRGNRVRQESQRRRVVEPAGDVQGPEVAEGEEFVAVLGEQGFQAGDRRGVASLGQEAAGGLGLPVVRARAEVDQGVGRELRQVERRQLPPLAVDDPVDPAVGLVPGVARVEVAGAAVVPVDDMDAAVGAEEQVDRPEPVIPRVDQRPAVLAPEGRAVRAEVVPVDGVRQQVAADERASERRRIGAPPP